MAENSNSVYQLAEVTEENSKFYNLYMSKKDGRPKDDYPGKY